MNFLIRGREYLERSPDFALVGREAELERLSSILMRSRASSVVLTGPDGTGATTLCMGLQASKDTPDAAFDIVRKRLFWLDTNALFALGENGQIVHAWERIMKRLESVGEPVLIIDDAHDFIESCRNAGTPYFINALLAGVRHSRMQVIFETSEEDLDLVVRSQGDVRQLFTIMPIDEPGPLPLGKMVQHAAERLSKHHGIKISTEAVMTSIELTTKYRTSSARAQPERSIDLLDRALAAYRLTEHRRPSNMSQAEWDAKQAVMRVLHDRRRKGELQISEWEEALDAMQASAAVGGPVFETGEMVDLRQKIRLVQADIDKSRADFDALGAAVDAKLELTRERVFEEFADISGISVSKLNQNEVEKLRGLEATLGARIYGQDEAVRRLADGVKVARIGRRGTGCPLAYLFLGPSGVGKTEVAKVLAGALLDDEASLTRFDMSEYMEKHAVAKLIGAPPGYEGFEAGGILTNLMRRNGYRVLLFDEIEKGHPDVYNIFLQVLSDGRLTDNIGRTVSFSDAIIIMTTNTGQSHFLEHDVSMEAAEAAARDELSATYRSEFLNRFAGRQNIICFKRLELPSIEKIVMRELGLLASAYRERSIDLRSDMESIREFCQDHYDPREGARGLPGYIQANLEPLIVNAVLDGRSGVATVSYDPIAKNLHLRW